MQPGPFCAESALPVGPSWGQASDSKVVCESVCVGVCVGQAQLLQGPLQM